MHESIVFCSACTMSANVSSPGEFLVFTILRPGRTAGPIFTLYGSNERRVDIVDIHRNWFTSMIGLTLVLVI